MMLQRYIFFLILLQKYTTFFIIWSLECQNPADRGYNKLQVFCVIIA